MVCYASLELVVECKIIKHQGGLMAETSNVSAIASRISDDIFRYFYWTTHPKKDDNFICSNPEHKSSDDSPKATHPGDVVFFYQDPYLQKAIYLHTDLKSYADKSITTRMLKSALHSLCMTVECANQSKDWRNKYSVDTSDPHEVRGLLFVHNWTKGYDKPFYEAIARVDLHNLPVAPGTILHYLGPHDIQRLYSIGNDIVRLVHSDRLPKNYTFYYPDLMLFRRHGEIWEQPATIEALTGPYLILKHGAAEKVDQGYVIYFNRPAATPEALLYLLDILSRYQMLESNELIRIRLTNVDVPDDMRSAFLIAKQRYARDWGFDPVRERLLSAIEIDTITSVTDTYNPGATGWRE
jgi:hypothetical protein